MKLNEVLIVPTEIMVQISKMAIETGNKDLLLLTQICRSYSNLPKEVVNNAFEAGWAYGHATFKNLISNKEEYIKNLEL